MKRYINYHFNEPHSLKEIQEYIDSTYSQHYVGEEQVQAFDMISSAGHGEGFCIGNIIKLASRYGKKEGKNRKDLLKIIHYGIMLLNIHDKDELRKKRNESTSPTTSSRNKNRQQPFKPAQIVYRNSNVRGNVRRNVRKINRRSLRSMRTS